MSAPGNFRNEPEGHLGNQAGYTMIGLALSTVLFPWTGRLLHADLGGAGARLRPAVDSFEDSVHVTTGGGGGHGFVLIMPL